MRTNQAKSRVRASTFARFGAVFSWLLLICAIIIWFGLKRGVLSWPPWWLSVLVTSACVGFAVRWVVLATRLRVPRRRGTFGAELIATSGIVVLLVGGLANWALSLQGFVVLSEGEIIPLTRGEQLQHFESGPLARLEEMDVVIGLRKVELVAAGTDHFFPRSTLEVRRGDRDPSVPRISPRSEGVAGPLRFFQGAFGFAPRIVILSGDRTVFDRVVPFLSERHGPDKISYEQSFTVQKEGLAVSGIVDLASLDEGMRGHATVHLSLSRDGEALGQGSLLPGHFAEIDPGGYRVGFAGLERWSEILLSRRNYGGPVIAGGVIAGLGAAFWGLAAWRRW